MISSPYLSIWEIAHRWNNIDPNKTDPENLPFEIQDTLRFLARIVLGGGVYLLDELFITIPNEYGQNKYENFIQNVGEIPLAYEICVTERIYDKRILDRYLINRDDFFRATIYLDQSFPDFWWDDSIVDAVGGKLVDKSEPTAKTQNSANARACVIDKSICQAVAKTLWAIYPDTNITQMTKHPSVLTHGGGKNYQGKNTLRDWLQEVAPEHIKNKRGRPATKKASNGAA